MEEVEEQLQLGLASEHGRHGGPPPLRRELELLAVVAARRRRGLGPLQLPDGVLRCREVHRDLPRDKELPVLQLGEPAEQRLCVTKKKAGLRCVCFGWESPKSNGEKEPPQMVTICGAREKKEGSRGGGAGAATSPVPAAASGAASPSAAGAAASPRPRSSTSALSSPQERGHAPLPPTAASSPPVAIRIWSARFASIIVCMHVIAKSTASRTG